MICKACKKKIDNIDIYCSECGLPTESFKEQFSVRNTIQTARDSAKPHKSSCILYTILVAAVLVVCILGACSNFITDNTWVNRSMLVVAFFVIPMLFVPFGLISQEKHGVTTLSQAFRYYPKLLQFEFFLVLYLFVLNLICQGDPILNIVQLILSLWGFAIAFPVIFLIFNNDENVLLSIKKAYIAGKYLRWQQFSFSVIVGVLLLVSAIPFLLLLPAALHFAGHLMNVWYLKQNEFHLYERSKDY